MSEQNGSVPVVSAEDLKVHFPIKKGFLHSKQVVRAVDGVSFDIQKGEILSLVGESGSGKTTTGKALLQLIKPTAGTVRIDGAEVGSSFEELRAFRRRAQMIYQDPYQSINPRHLILDIVAEPLDVNGLSGSPEERLEKCRAALESAGLTPAESFFYRYPYELSGGQRQRVAIASSLILGPEFVVADEPVSMLDASIRTGIVKLMLRMRQEKGITWLFITHDLALAWLISDRIAIMYLGHIVEIGTADEVIHRGQHPYTKALMSIIPTPGGRSSENRIVLIGEMPDAAEDIPGCKFQSRCPYCTERCRCEAPELREIAPGHSCACHLV